MEKKKKPAHDPTQFLSPFCTTADTKPSQTHWTPAVFAALRRKKKVHLSSSLQPSCHFELPFTNQVCLRIASLLILTQAFTKSAACVGRGRSLARHGRAHIHTHTHSYTHINNSQSEQPQRHLPTVTAQHMLLATRLVAQSRSCWVFFKSYVRFPGERDWHVSCIWSIHHLTSSWCEWASVLQSQ